MRASPKRVRPAAVAGRFYPGDPGQLRREVDRFLAEAPPPRGAPPKAIIAPHAGYPFSGPIAGTAFAAWRGRGEDIRRVVLLGPAHYVHFIGLATPSWTAFATPLGQVPVDDHALAVARDLEAVSELDEAHEPEHCLEVELPFLQTLLPSFTLVPVLVGETLGQEVDQLLTALWGGPETRFVVSSDLSHYHGYEEAQRLDGSTAGMIARMDVSALGPDQACGWEAIRGLVSVAKTKGLRAEVLDVRNSGDTAGSRGRVVGYGAFAFTETGGDGRRGTS